jgi:hypothetical protein
MSTFAPINPSEQGQSTKHVRLGSRFEDMFGRVFYYGYAATAVGRGKVARAAATITYHNSMNFQTAPAVGDKVVKVTLLGTALTADQYQDGWLTVNDGTGEGRTYPVEGNNAMATTTGTGVIYLSEPIDTAGAVSELNVDLNYNFYDELLPPADNGQAYIPVGVPICVGGLGAAEYGYVQTWGPCAVWRDETDGGLGYEFTWGVGTGTGMIEDADNVAEPRFGILGPAAGVDTEYQMVTLRISR